MNLPKEVIQYLEPVIKKKKKSKCFLQVDIPSSINVIPLLKWPLIVSVTFKNIE